MKIKNSKGNKIALVNLFPNKNKLIPKIRINIEKPSIKKTFAIMLKMWVINAAHTNTSPEKLYSNSIFFNCFFLLQIRNAVINGTKKP
jgi:hypothetical protein